MALNTNSGTSLSVPDRYPTTTPAPGSTSNNPTSSQTQGTASNIGTTTTNSEGQSNTNSQTQNMDPASSAALQLLIQQLLGGGTQQMAVDKAARLREQQVLTQQRTGYSKEAAFSDAQGAMAKAMRDALEKILPSINAGANAAGTSSNSARALYSTQAAARAAESSAALGLGAAKDYGNVSNNISQLISGLINTPDAATNALLSALNVAKGAVSNVTSQTNTSGTQTAVNSTQGTTGENKQIQYQQLNNPFAPTPTLSSIVNYGPVEEAARTPRGSAGIPADVLEALTGSSRAYSNVTF